MIKRKYADRSDWKRVTSRKYTQAYIETEEFKGVVALLQVLQVREPLFVTYADTNICIVDAGYSWLQHFPSNAAYAITTVFNSNGEIVQWYIDFCREIKLTQGEIPWFDDMFLDIMVLPSGQIFLVDEDELKDALSNNEIDQNCYNNVRNEAQNLFDTIKRGDFHLLNLSVNHRDMLLRQ